MKNIQTTKDAAGGQSRLTVRLGSTLNDFRSSPELCHERGWKAGTRLIGDEGCGDTIIEITAVGEQTILAKAISEKGESYRGYEGCWTLSHRDWHEVLPND